MYLIYSPANGLHDTPATHHCTDKHNQPARCTYPKRCRLQGRAAACNQCQSKKSNNLLCIIRPMAVRKKTCNNPLKPVKPFIESEFCISKKNSRSLSKDKCKHESKQR